MSMRKPSKSAIYFLSIHTYYEQAYFGEKTKEEEKTFGHLLFTFSSKGSKYS